MGSRRITYDEWKGKVNFNDPADVRRFVEVDLGLTWDGWTRSGDKNEIEIHYLEDDRQIDQATIDAKLNPILERGEDSTKRVGAVGGLVALVADNVEGRKSADKAIKKARQQTPWWMKLGLVVALLLSGVAVHKVFSSEILRLVDLTREVVSKYVDI